jgi:hypothetical protein
LCLVAATNFAARCSMLAAELVLAAATTHCIAVAVCVCTVVSEVTVRCFASPHASVPCVHRSVPAWLCTEPSRPYQKGYYPWHHAHMCA